ncbi:MAG: glycosyltransferase 61 family protein [Geminocystis sp.]|nr:glycosyltransferase 61 family protein [Geminocystis sp.]
MTFHSHESQIESLLRQREFIKARNYTEKLLEKEESQSLLCILKAYLALSYSCLEEYQYSQPLYLDLLLNCDGESIKTIAGIIFSLADFFFRQRDWDLATHLYSQGLEFDSQYHPGYIRLAYLFLLRGDFTTAMEIYHNLISQQPGLTIAYEKFGKLWQDMRDYSQAIATYQRGLEKNKTDKRLLKNLAYCYLKTRQTRQAKQILEYLLQLPLCREDYSYTYGELGYIAILQKNLKQAITAWQRLLDNNPQVYRVYQQWQASYRETNKNLSLISQIKDNSDDRIIANTIAGLLLDKKEYELAGYYYNLVAEKGETDKTDNSGDYSKEKITTTTASQKDLQVEMTTTIITASQKESDATTTPSKGEEITPPRQYYETARQWAEYNKLLDSNYYAFNLNREIYVKPPKTVYEEIHPSFYFPPTIKLPQPFVVRIPGGVFYLKEDATSSGVITKDGYLIGDLSPEFPIFSPNHPDNYPSKHSLLKVNYLSPLQKIRGRVLVLTGLVSDNYFHWLFDILPRFHLVELAGIEWHEVDYILIDNQTPFQKETISLLNIPQEKILLPSLPLCLQAEELIIPSFPGSVAWMPAWSCQWLREKILGCHGEKTVTLGRRLYISRGRSRNRRLINEKEVREYLENKGFETVYLETLSVKKQAELLSEAEIVVSTHGSGLSNIVFCKPHTKVIEVFSPNYVYPCYWLVSNLVNLDYHYLLGEIIGSHHFHSLLYPDSRLEDVYLDVSVLNSLEI